MNVMKDLYNSLNTDKGGLSSRKLSALAALITAIVITHRYTNPNNLDSIVITWLMFALLCLGLVTFGQLVQFKTGKAAPTDEPK